MCQKKRLWEPEARRARAVAVMDRFAFLSAQPWLFPPPERSVPPRGELGAADGSVTVVVDGVPRRLPRHLALRPDLGGAPVDPPARGGVAHHPLNADPAVVFDGCASVHFSEREQYGYPPAGTQRRDESVSDEEKNRDCGHPSSREAWETPCPVVGAAAADAVHMAFAPHDEWPDQAQFACSIRVRRAVVERDCRGHLLANRGRPSCDASADERMRRDASADENDVSSATCWLEMTVDGATHALDISQSRHVVVGPPADREQTRVDSPDAPEPHPTESSRAERGIRGGGDESARRRMDRRVKSRAKRRRDFRDDPGDVGDDERSNLPELDVSELDVPALDEHGSFGFFRGRKKRYERPPSGAGRDRRSPRTDVDRRYVDTPNRIDVSTLDVPEEHFDDPKPTPYVTIVFAHCSFNLYHHPGVLGCRRSSPANERARVQQVRDALVAAREAAREAARASWIESQKHEAGHTSHTSIARSASKHESLLEHAANVTARATSTLPRLAARAACEAVSFSLERSVGKRFSNVAEAGASAGASAAARALETALEALRSPELRSSLAFLRADDLCARASSDDERDEKTQALLDDARAFAALARNDASDADRVP